MKRILTFALLALGILSAGLAIALLTRVPIPSSFSGQLVTYTRNKPAAQITVALVTKDGTDIQAFGHDGSSIPVPDRSYELGAITQTFTGAIAARAVTEGRLSPNESVSDLLPLSRAAYTPSVYELLTHSSAYASYAPGISSAPDLLGRNPFSGIDANQLMTDMNAFKLTCEAPYFYSFSDFGAAALGAAISEVYDVDFYSILTIFAQMELGLSHTYVSLSRTVPSGWSWQTTDAYLASRGLTSTIGDMVAYVRLYLSPELEYLSLASEPFYEASAGSSLGYFWHIVDTDDASVLSATGETSHYSAQLLIDREDDLAVIVLSNYPSDRYGNVSDIASALFSEKLAEIRSVAITA